MYARKALLAHAPAVPVPPAICQPLSVAIRRQEQAIDEEMGNLVLAYERAARHQSRLRRLRLELRFGTKLGRFIHWATEPR
jgi:hypothetical protein